MTDTPPEPTAPLPEVPEQQPAPPVVTPLANPTRPVQDGVIDPVWGQWVHDRQADAQTQLQVRLTAAFHINTNAVWTVVPFPAPLINVGSNWQAGSNAWRAPRAGRIEAMVSLMTSCQTWQMGTHAHGVFVNAVGARVGSWAGNPGLEFLSTSTYPVAVAAGDLVTAQVYMTSPAISNYVLSGEFQIRYIQ